jgi:hypothetical protein
MESSLGHMYGREAFLELLDCVKKICNVEEFDELKGTSVNSSSVIQSPFNALENLHVNGVPSFLTIHFTYMQRHSKALMQAHFSRSCRNIH